MDVPHPKTKETQNTRDKSFPIPYEGEVQKTLPKCKKYGVNTFYNPYNTLRTLLVRRKNTTPDIKKCGIVYELYCRDCSAHYIEERASSFGIQVKEHPPPDLN